ncbi:MAG: type II toxin-antitoxin system VapB family antitoxin [Burkholderiales bacterium]|nr:type II toxin-antitoxin system VapB family antitoxin [Phycisphaerae bacterium]
MATNLKLDPKLVEKARKLGKKKTKREAVTEALEEYVGRRERLKILELAGTIDFDPAYDYKAARHRHPAKRVQRKSA